MTLGISLQNLNKEILAAMTSLYCLFPACRFRFIIARSSKLKHLHLVQSLLPLKNHQSLQYKQGNFLTFFLHTALLFVCAAAVLFLKIHQAKMFWKRTVHTQHFLCFGFGCLGETDFCANYESQSRHALRTKW